ncbi:hypothetical protein C5S53_09515 [Methanophagales archaeon]|nr:hypothetical protein C5S53_09515 [Methanophagales archaeon]
MKDVERGHEKTPEKEEEVSMEERQEEENMELPRWHPSFLVMTQVTVRGDIVQWFRELYTKCRKDSTFRRLYLDDPMKALLTELSRDVWQRVPSEEFDPRFEAELREKGNIRMESMEGPFDPESILELAERISKDDQFAKDFRMDPVGYLHRGVTLPAIIRAQEESDIKWETKISGKINSEGKTEVTVSAGISW